MFVLKKTDLLSEQKSVPSEADILELRHNYEVAKIFFDYFLSAVVGKVKWKKQVMQKKVSEIATISDEAMAILLLENSRDKWLATYNNSEQIPPTRYTANSRYARRYGGWKDEGRARFNVLCNIVALDRGINPPNDARHKKCEETEIMYLEEKVKGHYGRRADNECLNNAEAKKVEQVYDDLSDDDQGSLVPV